LSRKKDGCCWPDRGAHWPVVSRTVDGTETSLCFTLPKQNTIYEYLLIVDDLKILHA
jgi:hypothetical protein